MLALKGIVMGTWCTPRGYTAEAGPSFLPVLAVLLCIRLSCSSSSFSPYSLPELFQECFPLSIPSRAGQVILTFQGFVKEDLIQNLFIDVLNMDHIGVICEDELLVFLKLLEREVKR